MMDDERVCERKGGKEEGDGKRFLFDLLEEWIYGQGEREGETTTRDEKKIKRKIHRCCHSEWGKKR